MHKLVSSKHLNRNCAKYLQNECKASNYLFILFNYEENHTRNKKPEKSAAPYFLPLYLDSTCNGLRPSSTCPSHLIMKSSSWLCSTKFVTNHVVAVCEAKIAPQTAVTSGRSNSCRSCRQSQLLLTVVNFHCIPVNCGNLFSPNC